MDRKDLKHDKFVEEVGHTVEYLSGHKSQVRLYGAVGAAVVVLGLGWYLWSSHQASVRQEALAEALKIDDATVGETKQPPLLNFKTPEEKLAARKKAYAALAAEYHGSQEAAIAQMYLGSEAVDKGNLAEAEKIYKDVADSAPEAYASVAKVALGDVYAAQGKTAEAEKVLRDLLDHPTAFVSKEEATIHLAEAISSTKPAEARKLLEPLRTARSLISRSAIAVLGRLPGGTQDAPPAAKSN